MSSSAIRTSFNQLLIIYIILVSLANLETFSKYILHFEIFALILAVVGILSLEKRDEIKIPAKLMIIPFVIILASRLLPYLNNSVPLGYDPGIYKYAMEAYQQNLPYLPSENIDLWVRNGFEPGLFMITDLLYLIGLDTHAILTWVLVFFELLLGMGIYVASGRFFGKNVGILSFLIYSISIAQFKVFWYMYYKNVVALFIMLIALYLFRSKKYLPFIVTSAFIGALHRPTFLIFGFIYVAYIITNRKDLVKNVLAGIAVLAIALTFFIPNIKEAIFNNIDPIISANIGAGTFISFFEYQFLSLPYLAFALLGLFYLTRKKDFNLFFLWFLVCAIIVYFKLIFFNRFIIHLDIAMIILASIGIYEIFKLKNRFVTALLFILLLSSALVMYQNINDAKPLINENELNIIKNFNSLESNAYVMSTSSYYSPWILGYSGRKTIAPGLFDYDKWNFEEWETFMTTLEKEKAVEMLAIYERPLYIYFGEKKRINQTKFGNECFDKIFQENEIKIFKVLC